MDKIFAFIAAFAFLCVLAGPAAAASGSVLSTIQIKNETYYTPFPVEPGQYFDMYVSIHNIGSASTNIQCRLDSRYPFIVDSSENPLRIFNDFAANRDALIKYRVRVDDTAVEGNNELDFTCTDDQRGTASATFNIYVQARASTINVENVSVVPAKLTPGQNGRISIHIVSESPNYLKDFKVRIDPGSDVPFAVVNGTNERLFSNVDPFQSFDVPFDVVAFPSAQTGVYKLPVSVSYSDKLGATYTINQVTGIVVASDPNIEVSAESTDLTQAGASGKVLLRIMNRGLSGIKLLQVRLLDSSGQYAVLSAPLQYIGTINSDDYETAEYKVYVFPNATKPLVLRAEVSYDDASNNAYSQSYRPALALFAKSDALLYGLATTTDNTLVYGIVFIVALFLAIKYAILPLGKYAIARFSKQKQ